MIGHWINVHYTTVLLLVLCGIRLFTQKKVKNAELRYFWLTWISCLLLVAQDILESYTALDPSLRFWRTLLSVVGYTLRPVSAIGLLLSVSPPTFRTWKIWVPAVVNLGINLTAFFSPIAFSFDQNYDFVRGPLGFFVFAVGIFYMILTMVMIRKRFYEGRAVERWILIACEAGCLLASAVDSFFGGAHLNEGIVIGLLFLLFFLRTHDHYQDALTTLRNRQAFYDDSADLIRDTSAIASIDMNGLKELNDRYGHEAGDRGLFTIGQCLDAVSSRNTLAYRVGGDEFVLLFLHQNEEDVKNALAQIKSEVTKAGYSVSVGYAMKESGMSMDDVLRESDRKMYQDKALYYQQAGRDRRSSRR